MARDRDLLRLDRHGIAAESLGSELSSDMEVLPFFPQTLRMPKGAPEMRFHRCSAFHTSKAPTGAE